MVDDRAHYLSHGLDDPKASYGDRGIDWLHQFNRSFFPSTGPHSIKNAAFLTIYKVRKAIGILKDQKRYKGHIRSEWWPVMYYAAKTLSIFYTKDTPNGMYIEGIIESMLKNMGKGCNMHGTSDRTHSEMNSATLDICKRGVTLSMPDNTRSIDAYTISWKELTNIRDIVNASAGGIDKISIVAKAGEWG